MKTNGEKNTETSQMGQICNKEYLEVPHQYKLDRVSPIDNKPSTN